MLKNLTETFKTKTGDVIPTARLTVVRTNTGTVGANYLDGAPAALFTTPEGTVQFPSNTVTADSFGTVSVFLADGIYDLIVQTDLMLTARRGVVVGIPVGSLDLAGPLVPTDKVLIDQGLGPVYMPASVLLENTGGAGVDDGDKVDITVSAGGTSWVVKAAAIITAKIAGGAVTLAKMAGMASSGVLGQTSALGGTPSILSFAALKTAMAFVKGDVGLGSVDNTADADKPVSTAQGNSLAPKASPIFTGPVTSSGATIAPIVAMPGTVIDVTAGRQRYVATGNATLAFSGNPAPDTMLMLVIDATAASVITIPSLIDSSTGAAVPSITVGAGVRRDVLLEYTGSNYRVSNYTDSSSGAGVTDGSKADIVVSSGGTIWTIVTNAITSAKLATSAVTLPKLANLTGPGTIGRTTTGAGALAELTWAQVKTAIGLGNANDTSDVNKPVSGPQQTALDGKVTAAGGTLTGGVLAGVTATSGTGKVVRQNTAGNIIDVTIPNESTVSGATSFALSNSGTIPDGQEVYWLLINGTASDQIITIPSCFSTATGASITTFTLKASDRREIILSQAGSVRFIYGEQQPPSGGVAFGAYDTIAVGAITDLGTVASLNVQISGTATCTSLGTAHPVTKFCTLTGSSNFTKSANISIEGDQNFNGQPGDSFIARSTSAGFWRIEHISRADGEAVNGFLSTQNVASGGTAALKAAKGKNVAITGSTTITGFGNDGNGSIKFCVTIGSPLISHLAVAAVGPITCLGSKDIQAQPGDTFIALCESNAWTILFYMRKTGEPVGGFNAVDTITSAATVDLAAKNSRNIAITGSTGPITSFGVAPGPVTKFCTVTGTPTLTHGANLQCLNNENIVCRAGDAFNVSTNDGTVWVMMSYQRKDGTPLKSRVYEGPLSGLPAASGRPIGDTAIIQEVEVSGLTRPPTSTKIRRLESIVDFLLDGTTKAWKWRGRQDMFVRGGTSAAPVLADFTLAAVTGLIGEFMQTPAGFLATQGTIVDIDIAVNRKTTATGTPIAALFIGSVEVARATFAANVNSVARICAKIVVLDANTQYVTFSAPPGGASNVTPSSLYTSLNLNTALTWSVQISSAGTIGDIHNVSMISVAVGAG
jgi:hypothetical protein